MEYLTVDNETIPENEILKFRFMLKLWIVTNHDLAWYLRWNQDKTLLIVNVPAIEGHFDTDILTIFLCNRVDDFLWLLRAHGFDQCPPSVLKENERQELEDGCLIFRHILFKMSNYDFFNRWIGSPEERFHNLKQKGACTLPPPYSCAAFTVRKSVDEFFQIKSKIMMEMNSLEISLRKSLCNQGNESTSIPVEYVDRKVMDVPQYVELKEIAGNFGPVDPSEVKRWYGSMTPIYSDILTQDIMVEEGKEDELIEEMILDGSEPAEYMAVEEYIIHSMQPDTNEQDNKTEEVKQEQSQAIIPDTNENCMTDTKYNVEIENFINQQQWDTTTEHFDNVEELFENIDCWRQDQDALEDYHPMCDTTKPAHKGHEQDDNIEFYVTSTDDDMLQIGEDTPQFLTNCMQKFLRPIDMD